MIDKIGSNVYLIGPMGAGKTTIGRQLARRLGRDFLDSDREIEEQAGVDVRTIFEFEGEEGFRKRETRMLEILTARDGVVVATGGGAVLAEANRKMLSASGVVVFLRTSVDEQLKRTSHDQTRPLLHTDDRRAKLVSLAAERDPLYTALADLSISTEHRHTRSVVTEILRELESL